MKYSLVVETPCMYICMYNVCMQVGMLNRVLAAVDHVVFDVDKRAGWLPDCTWVKSLDVLEHRVNLLLSQPDVNKLIPGCSFPKMRQAMVVWVS